MSQIRTNSLVPAGGLVGDGGGVIQVVQNVVTSATTFSSGTLQIPISASITPQSSSSKILIIGQITATMDSSGRGFLSLTKSGSKISGYTGDTAGSRVRAVGNMENGDTGIALIYCMSYLDSPATTSSITYGIGMERDSNTMYFNRSVSDNDGGSRMRGASSITLLEISG